MVYFSRVVMYQLGSLYGTVLFRVVQYHNPYFVVLDNGNNLYISSFNGVYRWIRSRDFPVAINAWPIYGGPKIQLDTRGNLYSLGSVSLYADAIVKYRLLSNAC